jgi:hypothetical protein
MVAKISEDAVVQKGELLPDTPFDRENASYGWWDTNHEYIYNSIYPFFSWSVWTAK